MKKYLFFLVGVGLLFVSISSLRVDDEFIEDEWSFDEEEPLDYSSVEPEPVVYTEPPAPPAPPKKKEDPTATFYRKAALGFKSLTYDNLPPGLKKAFEEQVFAPVAEHIKKNLKVESLEFKRIPEVYEPGEEDHVFLIIGNLSLYNQKVKAILREMSLEGEKPHYSLTLECSQEVKLSALAKQLRVIDLSVKNLRMIFSDSDYVDTEQNNLSIKKGLNITGDVDLVGLLKPINRLTKIPMLRMFGSIKKDLIGTTINGTIPGNVTLGKGATLTDMLLGVEITSKLPNIPVPQVLLRGALSVPLKGQDKPAQFNALLEVGVEKATLSGSMAGMWNQPFGIRGLSIGEVGIGASVLYTGVLDGLALKGVMTLGDKIFDLATKGSLTEGVAFVGSLKGELSLKDIVGVANTTPGVNLPVEKIFKVVPNIAFENVTLQVVPVAMKIAGQDYNQGMTFDGIMSLFGTKTEMKVAVVKDGLKGSAKLPEIKIPGLFTFRGIKGSDGLIQPAELILNINKSSSKLAEFYAKGFVELASALLGGAQAEGVIDFSTAGMDIKMKSKLFDQFMFDVELNSSTSFSKSPVDMTVKATMVAEGGINELADRLRKAAIKKIGDPTEMKEEAESKMSECFVSKTK